ncbi:hypothetical protein C8R44DRAFT_942014 [Mycena epipterygia]|nr:hypothetical protein C8R44DRAFT_942014 [Mycena epipterygia]
MLIANQILRDQLHNTLDVHRAPNGIQGRLDAQIFLELMISRLAGGNTTRGRPVAGNAGGFRPERTRDRCLKHEFGIQIFAAALLLAQTMALSNREKIFSVPALTDVPSSVEHGHIAAAGMNTAISLPLSPSSTGNLIKSLVKNFQLTISRFLFFYSIKQGTLLPRDGEIIDGVPGFSSTFLREVMAGVGYMRAQDCQRGRGKTVTLGGKLGD